MDPFGFSPEQYAAGAAWLTSFATLATLAVIIASAFYAKKQYELGRETRRDQSRPYVVVSIDVEQQHVFMLCVENVGRSPAFNVRINFDKPPRSLHKDIENVRMLKDPIPTLPPRRKLRAWWEVAFDVFSSEKPYPHPLSYRVEVSYEDHEGHEYGPETYILDFRVYEGQPQGLKGLNELIAAVETLHRQQKAFTEKGLLVRTTNQDRSDGRVHRPIHLLRAMREKDKGGWIAFLRYWVGWIQRKYGLYIKEWTRPDKSDHPS
ncbi:MAG: hypothetical protein ABGZ36_10900 [Actinomycetota bacterium]